MEFAQISLTDDTDGPIAISIQVSAPATDDLLMGTLLLVGEQTFAIQAADAITNIYSGGDIDELTQWTHHSTVSNSANGAATLRIESYADGLFLNGSSISATQETQGLGNSLFLFGPEFATATLHSVDRIDPDLDGHDPDSELSANGDSAKSTKHRAVRFSVSTNSGSYTNQTTESENESDLSRQNLLATSEKVTRARTRNLTIFNTSH